MKKDKKKINHSLVGIIMGSKSDWGTMKHCSDTLKNFKIRHDVRVISAHRTPQRLHKYLKEAEKKGIEISDPDAREHVYGMPYSEWKEKYQK